MRSRWVRLLALLFTITLIAAACGDDGGSASDDATDDDAATADDAGDDDGAADDGDVAAAGCEATVPGTQIDYAPYAPGRSLDPPHSSGALVGGTELVAIYDSLMRFNPETGEFEPHLAESMTSNDDFTEWTLKLRPDITYGDGTPLDAEMVQANIDRYFPEEGTVLNSVVPFLELIESTEIVDPQTVVFTLSTPWAEFPYIFNDEPGMVVNVNALGADAEAFGVQPPPEAGVGPYIVERHVPGEELVMTAREDYWGGPVCIETLRFDLAASGAVIGMEPVYDAFTNGDVNVAFLRNSTVIQTSRESDDDLSMAWQDAGANIIFNMREGAALSDDTLRQAVALVIDPATINERAYGGDLPAVGKALILEGSPFYSEAADELPTDPARAEELVAESGFTGTLDLLCASGPEATETSIAVEAQLEAIGIDVAIENLPTTDQIGKLVTGDYDMGCWGMNAGPDTAVTGYLRNLLSTSPSNRQGYASPEMDEAIFAALASTRDELPEALAAINNVYLADFAGVPFGSLEEGIVYADNVKGIKQTGSTIFMFDDAYMAQ